MWTKLLTDCILIQARCALMGGEGKGEGGEGWELSKERSIIRERGKDSRGWGWGNTA